MVSNTLIIAAVVFLVVTVGTAYLVMQLAGNSGGSDPGRRRRSDSKGARQDRERE